MTARERMALVALQQAAAAIVAATAALQQEEVAPAADALLNAREAARRTGMSTRWLYLHATDLPFAVRTSGRAVRFSARGIEEWLLKRRDA